MGAKRNDAGSGRDHPYAVRHDTGNRGKYAAVVGGNVDKIWTNYGQWRKNRHCPVFGYRKKKIFVYNYNVNCEKTNRQKSRGQRIPKAAKTLQGGDTDE